MKGGTPLRDLRDPQLLGKAYLRVRKLGLPIEQAVDMPCADWRGDGLMSNDPALHHSGTRQDIYIESDGGD